jgi:hypothetical protein
MKNQLLRHSALALLAISALALSSCATTRDASCKKGKDCPDCAPCYDKKGPGSPGKLELKK